MEKGRTFNLYHVFIDMFPVMAERIKSYGPFDRDSIKINTKDRKVYIFSYFNERDWGLQTYKNYIDSHTSRLKHTS